VGRLISWLSWLDFTVADRQRGVAEECSWDREPFLDADQLDNYSRVPGAFVKQL